MRKTITAVVAAGVALFSGASAGAQTTAAETDEAPAFTPAFAASRAGAAVDLWPTKHNFATTFGAELQMHIAKKALLDLSYSAAFAHVGDAIDVGDNIGFGNPTVGVHFADSTGRRFAYFVGASVTAPALQDPSGEVSNAAFYGQRIRGFFDADRFTLGHLAARLAVGMELQGMGPFVFRGELRPVVLIPTSGKHPAFPNDRTGLPTPHDGDAAVTIEHAMELELRADTGLGAGLRLQGVIMPTQDDKLQTLAEPFVQFTPKRQGAFARLGFPVALDRELGFGLTEEDKLAMVRVNVGGQW